MGRVLVNGPGDLGSIPGRVILKTFNMVLDTSLLNTQQYKVKWGNSGKGVAPSPKLRCSSYWKGSLLVALDYGNQLYFLTSDDDVMSLLTFQKSLRLNNIKEELKARIKAVFNSLNKMTFWKACRRFRSLLGVVGWCTCEKCEIICVFSIHNSLCGISSDSGLF